MNIAYCTDNNYVPYCGISIVSLFYNNKEQECMVYVIGDNLTQKNIGLLKSLEDSPRHIVKIVSIDSDILHSLTSYGRYQQNVYYRYLIPELLPECDKILYLDCDTIINDSLKELWDEELDSYSLAVVEDQGGDDVLLHNRLHHEGKYFNSGVFLMNLEKWRSEGITLKLIKYIKDNPELCVLPDQDALNKILKDQVVYLPYRYNYQERFLDKDILKLNFKKWEEIDSYISNPTIIHYTEIVKPWHKECVNPYKDKYLKYKALSPWNNMRTKRYFSVIDIFVILFVKLSNKYRKQKYHDHQIRLFYRYLMYKIKK